jgi:small GTP-binding protein
MERSIYLIFQFFQITIALKIMTIINIMKFPFSRNNKTDFHLEYDYVIKTVIIGDACTGKSSLMKRYIDNVFIENNYCSTIGIDLGIKKLTVSDNNNLKKTKKSKEKYIYNIKAQIWDTAGQERFKSIAHSFYRCMKIGIVCFDYTKFQNSDDGNNSMINVTNWLDEINKHSTDDDVCIYVIGTKVDGHDKNFNVSIDEINKHIDRINNYKNMNIKFMGWCSSRNNIYIDKYQDINKYYNFLNTSVNPDKINIIPTINDMFEEVIIDYIETSAKIIKDKQDNSKIYDLADYENFSNEESDQSCCTIS